MTTNYRIEPLKRDNYDTWKVQAKAILIKNGTWGYVNGTKKKSAEEPLRTEWEAEDMNAKSDLILIISPSELNQVKNCNSSKDVWDTLERIYSSSCPARKATLLKRLVLSKLKENGDVRDHLNTYMDTIDKLNELGIDINNELLSVMMLYSLPQSFETFRVAIETRDTLPNPEDLRVKIIEENQARSVSNSHSTKYDPEGAYYSNSKFRRPLNQSRSYKEKTRNKEGNNSRFEFRCHRCNKPGHMIRDCKVKIPNENKKKGESTFKVEQSLTWTNDIQGVTYSWCLDSGSTSHVCSDEKIFVEMNESQTSSLKLAAKSQSTPIIGSGKVKLDIDEENQINLPNTLYVPSLTTNLLSVAKITDNGFTVLFRKNEATIADKNKKIILKAERRDGLYYVNPTDSKEDNEICNHSHISPIEEWHRKLGHVNYQDLKMARKRELLQGLDFNINSNIPDCEVCIQGKMTRLPFPKRDDKRSTEILNIIHSDVFGPVQNESNGGAKYFVTFIDDYSRYCQVYFLAHKNEVFEKFKEFKNEVEKSTGKKIKYLQSDNEVSEYCNRKFDNYLKENGIQRRLSVKYTPEQNGVAERKNRTLVEKARCLLIEANLPLSFWAEAINTSNYLCNRLPSSSINGEIPLKRWSGRIPSVRHLHVFGSKTYVLNKRPNRKSKFTRKTIVGIFLGYSSISKAYRVWIPSMNKTDITRDIRVLNEMYIRKKSSVDHNFENDEESLSEIGHIESEFSEIMLNEEIPIPEFNTISKTTEKKREADEEIRKLEDNINELHNCNENFLEEQNTTEEGRVERNPSPCRNEMPNSEKFSNRPSRSQKPPSWTNDYYMDDDYTFLSFVNEEMQRENSKEWNDAIKNEIKAHLKNETWKIVNKTEGKHVIDTRMVLTEKYKSNGELERKKARLVARGFAQRPGLDYADTYSPVAKLSSIRFLIGMAVEENLILNQMDVSTAFLNGDIEEEIYIKKPENLEKFLLDIIMDESKNEDKNIFFNAKKMLEDIRKSKTEQICKLQKSIYGLKQASRRWFSKLDDKLKEWGFKPSHADPCIYSIHTEKEKLVIGVYVDDFIIAGSNQHRVDSFKRKIQNTFETRDLGELNFCLGIKFEKRNGAIYSSQVKYIEDILKKFNMDQCRPVVYPMEAGCNLKKNEGPKAADYPYQNLIGSLMYLAVATRPDISYAVSYLSQFNTCYGQEHWIAAKRILRYLKGTKNFALKFYKTGKKLVGMADADWASDKTNYHSYSGYCFIYGGAAISWESKKQKSVALSSCEAEYMALTHAAKEAIHLKQLANDSGLKLQTVTVFNDNQSAKNMSENPIISSKSKHIHIREHFIREAVADGSVKIEYLPTDEMDADIFTKPLLGQKFINFRNNLGLTEVRE